MSLAVDTLGALLAPRRLLPVLCVGVPLVAAQWWFSRDGGAVWLGVAMVLAFLSVSPLCYRYLLGASGAPRAPGTLRLLAYLAASGGVVALVGGAVPAALGYGITFLTDPMSLAIAVAFSVVGGWGLGRDIELEARLARAEERARDLAREAEQAQLLALRSHLDPHFLFNTLNAIAEWCREDGEVAERATLELSRMLRTVLLGVKASAWPLRRELELAQTLFSLHLIRDPERFAFSCEAPDPLPDLEVPPMILLPLAENAMKHGPGAGHGGTVRLVVRAEPTEVVLELVSPGPYAGRREGGEGLSIVERRLALAYEGGARLQVRSEGDGTLARVTLPRAHRRPTGHA